MYTELIRSDILGSSSMSPSRTLASRSSLPSVMKTSREGPLVVKPTWDELQAPSRVVGKEEEER